eukprot:gene3152-3945_t
MTILNNTQVFGGDNSGNFLWGLPIQFHWQFESGRLQTVLQSNGQYLVNEYSWWADINYYLSVIPYLSAAKYGLVPPVTFTPPQFNSASKFCLTHANCNQNVMAAWDSYFNAIVQLKSNPNYITKQQLLSIMWKAHSESVVFARGIFKPELDLFNAKERKFGNGWAHFVEILDIVLFETNKTQVETLGTSLPSRMLKLLDIPPFIFDMTPQMNNIIVSMFAIDDMSKLSLVWTGLLDTLKDITANPKCLALIQSVVNDFASNPIGTFLEILIRVIGDCN